MAYIYKITNDINDKVYIGKTEFSIEKRFKEHCTDAFRERNEKRPLYNAMKKYGIEHFSVEFVEETSIPEEREQYWINFYKSYGKGYNATLGGEGKPYINQEEIMSLWNKGYLCQQIADITGHDPFSISRILQNNGISKEMIGERRVALRRCAVNQLDKDTKQIITSFRSISEASQEMIKQGFSNCKPGTASTHISEVCRGKRKTFAGFAWEYVNS